MKYTLITGATRGIGYETAKRYAMSGHSLILIGRDERKLEQVKDELSLFKVEILTYPMDLTKLNEVEVLFKTINQHFDLEILIHNAGVGDFLPLSGLTPTSISEQLDVNVKAPMLITSLCIENIHRNKGSIVFLVSVLSDLPNKYASVYVATKHGILGFANSIRLEYPKLHVLTVHPVTVRTDFFHKELPKKGFILTPEDVANKLYKAQQKHKRRLNIPRILSFIRFFYLLFPGIIDHLNAKYFTNK